MSAKSSIKTLIPKDDNSRLFKWVALLTGSKNALKGIGFFMGAFLLTHVGFSGAMYLMASVLFVVMLISLSFLKSEIGKATFKPKFTHFFSNSSSLNNLALSRFCLFAARDVWFVVALPVYLAEKLQWQHEGIGVFMACWVVFYGVIQTVTPKIVKRELPNGQILMRWAITLCLVVLALIAFTHVVNNLGLVIVVGLLVFGSVFAINSSLHSYVIVALAKSDGVSMDVGFYYMANASGRLVGTILSGLIYQYYGLEACLYISSALALSSGFFIKKVKM